MAASARRSGSPSSIAILAQPCSSRGWPAADDSIAAFAGFRYHFGAGNSLEMRHRHELPLREHALRHGAVRGMPGSDIINVFVPE